MKHIICAMLAILIFTRGFNQKTEPEMQLTKQDYLKKSKHEKTIGWILCGAGTTMIVGGLNLGSSHLLDDNSTAGDISLFLVLGGLITDLFSIDSFISSARNDRKAATITFSSKKMLSLQHNAWTATIQPTITLKIRLWSLPLPETLKNCN